MVRLVRNEYGLTRWTNAEGASPNLGLHSSDHFLPAVWGLRVEQGDVSWPLCTARATRMAPFGTTTMTCFSDRSNEW